jgi:hypothetical protein
MICADFKTIKSFCRKISKWSSLFVKWSQNDHVFSDWTFWSFLLLLRYLFRAQSVHAKATLSCDRRYYKKRDDDRWWWSTSDVTRVVLLLKAKCFHALRFHSLISLFSSNFYMSVVIIISCLSRWSYCAICLWKLSIMWDFMHSWECSVSNYQLFFINVSFEKSTMSSSFAWASLRCLNCSSSSVARRYFDILMINSKMFKRVIKFVSRLFYHIFFRRSSSFEHFSIVWCIVCFRASHEHFENSAAFILWK